MFAETIVFSYHGKALFLEEVFIFGIQIWGCAKPSHTKIIQRLQSNVLRTITNAPWYISNFTLHNDLQIPFITEEIKDTQQYTITNRT
jgi:hypothetical protein